MSEAKGWHLTVNGDVYAVGTHDRGRAWNNPPAWVASTRLDGEDDGIASQGRCDTEADAVADLAARIAVECSASVCVYRPGETPPRRVVAMAAAGPVGVDGDGREVGS